MDSTLLLLEGVSESVSSHDSFQNERSGTSMNTEEIDKVALSLKKVRNNSLNFSKFENDTKIN